MRAQMPDLAARHELGDQAGLLLVACEAQMPGPCRHTPLWPGSRLADAAVVHA